MDGEEDRVASRRRDAFALIGVLAFAFVLRFTHLVAFATLPIADAQLDWPHGDMAAYWAWSGKILAGDVLGRDTPHHFAPWMSSVAPIEIWERWWGGRQIFHNAPLYAYLLAAARLVAGDGFRAVASLQLLLGLTGVAFAFAIARRLFGRPAAVCAALGTALYGPGVLYESFALRDTLGATTSLALLWALLRAPAGGPRRLVLVGLLFAVALLARETTLGFLPFVAGWMLYTMQWRWRRFGTAVACFAVGAFVGLLPLIARNLVVNAPPLALSSVGVLGLIYGQVADTTPALATMPPSAVRVMQVSEGQLARALPLIWATYDGNPLRLAANQLRRLGVALSSFEAWDNVNWEYFRTRSPVLPWTLRFEIVLALGILGIVVERESLARHAPLWLFVIASVLLLLVTCFIGRYRLPLAWVLCIYSGATVARGLDWLAERRWRELVAAGALATMIVLAARSSAGELAARNRQRETEFQVAAEAHLKHGRVAAAVDELLAGLQSAYRGADQRTLPPRYAGLLRAVEDLATHYPKPARIAAELERLGNEYPDDASVRLALAGIYRDALGRRDLAALRLAEARRLRADSRERSAM